MSVQGHELHLLTGSYSLDALTDDEQAGFEEHLARCPSCAEEVRGLRETAARLAMATAVTPPPGMRPRVLAAAPRTRQLPPGRNLPTRAGERTGLRRRTLSRAGLTAGVLALAAAAAFLLVTQTSVNRQLQQAQASNSAIAAVLAAPDARIVTSPVTGGGTATVVVSRTEDTLVFTSSDLPALSAAKVYQLWLIGAAGARSAGLVPEASAGRTAPVLASGLKTGDKLGMTVEPSGGSSSPTTTPILVLPLPE